MGFAILIWIFQGLFFFMFLAIFIPTKGSFEQRKIQRTCAQILLSFLTVLCFYFASFDFILNNIFPENVFLEYSILTLSCLSFFWLMQIDYFVQNKWLAWISYTLLGAFFWLSLFSCVKLILIVSLVIFPLYGFLVAAPFFVSLMVTHEILRLKKNNGRFNFLQFISLGLGFLLVFQLLMNLWSDEQWELIKLFKPTDISF